MLRQAFVSPTKPKSWGQHFMATIPLSAQDPVYRGNQPCFRSRPVMSRIRFSHGSLQDRERGCSLPGTCGGTPPGISHHAKVSVCRLPPKLDEFFKLIRPQCVLIRGNDDCLSKDFYITLAGILGCCTLTIRIGASQGNQTTLMPRCGECRQLTTVRDRNCNH